MDLLLFNVNMIFTDTHSHLHFPEHFQDLSEIFERAEAEYVNQHIIVGCTKEDSLAALAFIKKYSDKKMWSTLGIHPHNAEEVDETALNIFQTTVKQEPNRIVAIGEIGLDYFRNLQPRHIQHEAFEKQLKLALEFDLPVIIHIRDAWDDALTILQKIGNRKVLLHCFTGDTEIAQKCWQREYITSFSGVLTYPKNEYLRDVAKIAPNDKIVLETDCPYLPPQPYRGKRNEPAYMIETAETLAKLRGISMREIAQITTENAEHLFNLK